MDSHVNENSEVKETLLSEEKGSKPMTVSGGLRRRRGRDPHSGTSGSNFNATTRISEVKKNTSNRRRDSESDTSDQHQDSESDTSDQHQDSESDQESYRTIIYRLYDSKSHWAKGWESDPENDRVPLLVRIRREGLRCKRAPRAVLKSTQGTQLPNISRLRLSRVSLHLLRLSRIPDLRRLQLHPSALREQLPIANDEISLEIISYDEHGEHEEICLVTSDDGATDDELVNSDDGATDDELQEIPLIEKSSHDGAIADNIIFKLDQLPDNHGDSRLKDILGWVFLITNFTLELFSAIFDQLSSKNHPHYALIVMLCSFIALMSCIAELISKGQKERVTWKWRGRVPWFYRQTNKPFGTLWDIIGFACAFLQCVVTAINYSFISRRHDNPIKISALPILFAFGLLFSKYWQKPDRNIGGNPTTQNGGSTYPLRKLSRSVSFP